MGILSVLFGGGREKDSRVWLKDVKDQSSAWDFFVDHWYHPTEMRRGRKKLTEQLGEDPWGKDPWGW